MALQFSFVVSKWLGYQIPNLFETPESLREFDEALSLLRANGFDGVELNLNFNDKTLLTRIVTAVDQAGLKLAAIGTGLLYSVNHLSFTDPDPAKRARAVTVVKDLIRFAAEANANVIIGMIRGVSPLDNETVRGLLGKCMEECDSAAEECGTKLALEAINRYETQSLNTAQEVATLIDELKLRATGLLLDAFHMNIEERSIDLAISNYVARIAHFHVADSNRWAPGNGHLNIDVLLRQLMDLGYQGWVSAEVVPKPSPVDAVKETADYLKLRSFLDH
jgi:sugar phosphate isomerase/epimerase